MLEAEIASLGEAAVHVITADENSLEAISPNLSTQHTVQAAFEAGAGQAARERDALTSTWR